MRPMRPRWIVPAVLAASVAGSVLLTGAAGAYVVAGQAWPGGVIRYYNDAPDQAWAVKRAVDAWNASGAQIRFVAAPASTADVRIEHFASVSCTINAEATIGYTENARIWIFRRDERSPYCNSFMAARSLAHEFGHVLGLGHETHGCSLMNPRGALQGPQLCPKAKLWQWRCRLLTPDDVTGAIALYGGTAAPPTGPSDCDLYPGIAAPTGLRVAATTVSHQFRLSFRRPAPVTVPAFLSTENRQPESFVVASAPNRCPADARRYHRILWDAAVGATEITSINLPTGTSCISVWAVDSYARPSDRPATTTIRVVEAGQPTG